MGKIVNTRNQKQVRRPSPRDLRKMVAAIPRNIEKKNAGTTDYELELKTLKAEYKRNLESLLESKADIAKVNELQRQTDAIEIKIAERITAAEFGGSSLEKLLKEDEQVSRLLRDKKGVAYIELPSSMLERKTTIDSAAVGSQATGVLQIDRTAGIVQEARQAVRMRSVLTSRPTSLGIIDFLKVNSGPSPASMQTESSLKTENAVTFTAASEKVQTIATLIPASRQCLDDMTELLGYLQNALPYEVDLREETQILHGSGTGNDIHGLVVQATAFNTGLLTALDGWTKSDQVSAAVQQIQVATEAEPSFVVLHPTDFWQIRRVKDSQRRYLFAGSDSQDPFWGLQPITTVRMGIGNFLVGSGSPVAAELRDRTTMQLEISTQHSDFFARNMCMFRAERRVALVTYRPGSYIFGSFTTSP